MRAHSNPWLIVELTVLMAGLPVILFWTLPVKYLLLVIWAAALYAYGMTRWTASHTLAGWWERTALTPANLIPIFKRFAWNALLLTALTWWWKPELLFSFVRERPGFWLLIMFLYPLLSVVPQEIIFRSFFFERYRPLFANPRRMILASGVAFGLAHILFHNWVAPLLCTIGGMLFARTYQNHRSLWLVVIEHALYGDFLFTVGLGRYFYHGSVNAVLH